MKKMRKQISFFVVLILVVVALGKERNQQQAKDKLRKEILRFHIRANSNQVRDQLVKYKVRDAVIAYLRPKMDQASSKISAKKVIRKEKKNMIKLASKVLRKNHQQAKVSLQIKREHFPEKCYGHYRFPEGDYDAVRMNLGEGKGHNWWCVMFPELCVTKKDELRIREKAKKQLEALLGKEKVKELEETPYWF